MVAPTYRLTVPQSLYDAMCSGLSQEFADSYLFGATLEGNVLTPRTEIGWSRMKDRFDCVKLLKTLGLSLARPTPWPGQGDRLSADDAYYDAGMAPPKGKR